MRRCPYCQAENRVDAPICYHCGRDLLRSAPTGGAPHRPSNPAPSYRRPPPQYTQIYEQLPRSGQSTYRPPAAYRRPPSRPPAPEEEPRPAWSLLIVGLSMLLVFALGIAGLTLFLALRNSAGGAGAQVSTQLGQPYGSPGSNAPAPMNTPTLWPTLTPSQSSQRTPTPNRTQTTIADKLLSPECKGALDLLGKVGDQVKNDPLKVMDDAWRKDVDQATAQMTTYCGSLETASPIPGELGQVQKLIDQSNSEFEQAKLLWGQAVDQRDLNKAASAAQHVSQATAYLGQALSRLQKLVP